MSVSPASDAPLPSIASNALRSIALLPASDQSTAPPTHMLTVTTAATDLGRGASGGRGGGETTWLKGGGGV